MRTRFVALAVSVGAAFAFFASCSFPDPEIRDLNVPDQFSGGADVTVGDVIVAEGSKPDTGPCPDPCDCDQDKYPNKLCDGGIDGAFDCDDTDPRAYPGADFVAEAPVEPTNGNWDCQLPIEKQYAEGVTIQTCTLKAPGTQCDQTQGFRDTNIPCGAEADFVTCKTEPTVPLESCQGTVSRRKQGCK